jgi:hypothetical protein
LGLVLGADNGGAEVGGEGVLEGEPGVLDGDGAAGAADEAVDADLVGLDGGAGEDGAVESKLDEDEVDEERDQGPLAEGQEVEGDLEEKQELAVSRQHHEPVVVRVDEGPDVGRQRRLGAVAQRRQQERPHVRQHVEQREDDERRQRPEERLREQPQNRHQQVVDVVVPQHLRRRRRLGPVRLLQDDGERRNDGHVRLPVPEAREARRPEYLQRKQAVEDRPGQRKHMAHKPPKLRSLKHPS